MSKPKEDGRTVRALIGGVDWEIAQAKQAMINSLGSTDPLVYHRAMKTALIHLERAHVTVLDIEKICEAAARRGSYDKEMT